MVSSEVGRSVMRHPSKVKSAGSTPAPRSTFIPWTLSDFKTVANKYGRNVVQITLGDSYCQANGTEEYLNRSYVSFPNIYLGIYDDDEFKLASFFHELGHVLVPEEFIESVKYYTPDVEREVWRLGFELAKNEYGLMFSQKVNEWVEEQINTYIKGWERERKFVENSKSTSSSVVE